MARFTVTELSQRTDLYKVLVVALWVDDRTESPGHAVYATRVARHWRVCADDHGPAIEGMERYPDADAAIAAAKEYLLAWQTERQLEARRAE